jgi:hypothetical protein
MNGLPVLIGFLGGGGLRWIASRRGPDWGTLTYMLVAGIASLGVQYLWVRHRSLRGATTK